MVAWVLSHTGSGIKDVSAHNKALKMADRAQRRMNKMAKVRLAVLIAPCAAAC